MDELPRFTSDPAAAVASLQAHLVTASILTMLREAWTMASDDGKRALADRILVWAGLHVDGFGSDLVAIVLRDMVERGEFSRLISEDRAREIVDALTARLLKELADQNWSGREMIRTALVQVARDRLADVASELAVAALAGDSEHQ